MLYYFIFGFLCVPYAVSDNVTTTVATVVDNRTQPVVKELLQNFSPMIDSLPAFSYDQHGRIPLPLSVSASNYPVNKAFPNPRNNVVQYPTESFPYIYEPNPNYGHPIVEHENESGIKPSARHFIIVSFIGLLVLFAIIQNTIEANKRKTALVEVLSSRRKRDLSEIHSLNDLTPEEEDIFNDDARVRCLQWAVCLQNRKLLQDFGTSGKVFAKYLSHQLNKILKTYSGWGSLVEDAGIAGLNGEDCDIMYRDCN